MLGWLHLAVQSENYTFYQQMCDCKFIRVTRSRCVGPHGWQVCRRWRLSSGEWQSMVEVPRGGPQPWLLEQYDLLSSQHLLAHVHTSDEAGTYDYALGERGGGGRLLFWPRPLLRVAILLLTVFGINCNLLMSVANYLHNMSSLLMAFK